MSSTKLAKLIMITEGEKLKDWFPDVFETEKYKTAYATAVSNNASEERLRTFPWLYYHTVVMSESPSEIGKQIRMNKRTVQDNLQALGLSRTLEESQKLCNERGHRDYGEIIRKGRITRLKALEDTGLFGTNGENRCRSMMGELLPEYISKEHYEYIVGINYSCAVGTYEIDIPVMVVDKLTGNLYKFAVEYNGAYFHDGAEHHERDQKKFRAFTDAGWKLITMRADSNVTNSDAEFERRVREVCAEIADSIVLKQQKLSL